jgi:sporulation protein YlmC with PRC-barrel domain
MDIALNAEVQCTDGNAGHVSRVILNPIDDELTHIVVKHHSGEHEIGVSHIMEVNQDTVKLNCSTDYLEKQPDFIETEYIRTPLEHRELDANGYFMTGYYYMPYVTMETVAIEHEQIPEGEVAFNRGTHVFAKEGRIGRVDEMVVNPDTYHITHIVLREGHLWGQKDVVIGVEHIKNVDDDGVHLKLSKAQVEALPTIPLNRRYADKLQEN